MAAISNTFQLPERFLPEKVLPFEALDIVALCLIPRSSLVLAPTGSVSGPTGPPN